MKNAKFFCDLITVASLSGWRDRSQWSRSWWSPLARPVTLNKVDDHDDDGDDHHDDCDDDEEDLLKNMGKDSVS